MHSKLMLLFHPGYLRIVVPTANLIQVDWGDHNLMENVSNIVFYFWLVFIFWYWPAQTVFMIDLPLKSKTTGVESSSGDNDDGTYTHFYSDLVNFLKASSYPQGIIDKVVKFDFSKTARYAFVHSMWVFTSFWFLIVDWLLIPPSGGSHTGESWRKTGYTGLGRAVSCLGLRSQSPITVDFVVSPYNMTCTEKHLTQ